MIGRTYKHVTEKLYISQAVLHNYSDIESDIIWMHLLNRRGILAIYYVAIIATQKHLAAYLSSPFEVVWLWFVAKQVPTHSRNTVAGCSKLVSLSIN